MLSLGCVTGLGSDLCLSRSGIETSIIVPGAFTGGTNHFAHPGSPKDKSRAPEYDAVPYAGLGGAGAKGFFRHRTAGPPCRTLLQDEATKAESKSGLPMFGVGFPIHP